MRIADFIFFTILFCFAPIWIAMLIIMVCYSIAFNFYGSINKGHQVLGK